MAVAVSVAMSVLCAMELDYFEDGRGPFSFVGGDFFAIG